MKKITQQSIYAMLFALLAFTGINKLNAQVSTFAGSGTAGAVNGNNLTAQFNYPQGIAVAPNGDVYVADEQNNQIRKISGGIVTIFAGSGTFGSAEGQGTAAQFANPNGVAIDINGNVYVSDQTNFKIRKITPSGLVSTLAGSGIAGFADGPAQTAKFHQLMGVAVDNNFNVYVADVNNQRIRKIDVNGVVTTLAGNGNFGYVDATGTAAEFQSPHAIAVEANGNNIYVVDRDGRIRKITNGGIVSTYAGGNGYGFLNGPGSTALFGGVRGISLDASGNLYAADFSFNRIRKIANDINRTVSTLAGTGASGSLDGAATTVAQFNGPVGVAVDANGNVFVSDQNNHKIRKITLGCTLPAIGGASAVCKNATITLTNATIGGVWSSQNNSATVNASTGVVTGVSSGGTATIVYSVAGCGSVNKIVAINSIPAMPSISYTNIPPNPQNGGNGTYCLLKAGIPNSFGVTGTPATNLLGTGTWSSSDQTVMTVTSSGGFVQLVASGNVTLTYTYTFTNGCSNKRSIFGTVSNCNVPRGVNINELIVKSGDFTMYPNPVRSVVNLQVEILVGRGSIVVTNLYGKQVKMQALSMGTNTVDVSNLAKGMYFISTITNEGKTTKKLVVE